jgi:hypothetical protein
MAEADRFTVRVEVDSEGWLDIHNASMYAGVGSMTLRKLCNDETLTAVKRTALDDPRGAEGRVKWFIHVDTLDGYLAERAASKVAGGQRTSSKVMRIKSVRKMVSEMNIDADRMAITVETLNDLLQAAIAETNAKRAAEAAEAEAAAE